MNPYHVARTSSRQLSSRQSFHTHDFDEIFLVTEGSILHRRPQGNEILSVGAISFIDSTTLHALAPNGKQYGSFINVAFPKKILPQLAHMSSLVPLEGTKKMGNSQFERVKRVFEEVEQNSFHHPHLADVVSFVAQLTMEFGRSYDRVEKPQNSKDRFIQAVNKLEELENCRVGIEFLLTQTSVSMAHLCRTLKAKTGKTPSELVHIARMSNAKKLLLSSDLTIDQISFELGYENPSYFYRQFKRQMNISPSEFRQRESRVANPKPEPRSGSISLPASRSIFLK
jgi:AraC family transcriptional regulator, dual regulator of chb operon